MSKEVVTMAGTDAMHERIAAHPWPRGGVEVIRANRGDTLYGRRTGGQVARLRPTGENDDVQILWWRGAGWATPGDFGPLIMPLNEALNFVATESFFWIGAYPSKRHEMCKLKLRIGRVSPLRLHPQPPFNRRSARDRAAQFRRPGARLAIGGGAQSQQQREQSGQGDEEAQGGAPQRPKRA